MSDEYIGKLEPGTYDLGDLGVLYADRTFFGDLDLRLELNTNHNYNPGTEEPLEDDYIETGDDSLAVMYSKTLDGKLFDIDIQLIRM